ncbi:universal stress protein [Streptomyces sp. NPDC003456]|uniref:universal stress protein n=1 Tax=Streptomyces sp. NPDC003456 TaxID=3364683 RepID=UPI00368F3249
MRSPVLACIDGSECAAAAAEWAAREAGLRGVALRLLHVVPRLPGTAVPVAAKDHVREIGAQLVRRTVEDLAGRYPDLDVEGAQAEGAEADAALDAAARDAGLLVAGTRGAGGFRDLAVGSTALRVAAAAPCPVVLVPPRPGTFPDGPVAGRDAPRVVLGFDAHHPTGEATDFAFSAAALRSATLRVVQAWVLPAESVSPRSFVVTEEDRATWEDREVLDLSDAVRPWQEKYPQVRAALDLRLMHPAEALLNASRDAELLVVGRCAEAPPAGGRLGPVAHAVLHHVRCPVAVVPPGAAADQP